LQKYNIPYFQYNFPNCEDCETYAGYEPVGEIAYPEGNVDEIKWAERCLRKIILISN
jgi:hypothetical protein